jgi:hypothetical protein
MKQKDIDRFWSKVDRRGPDECWLWLAGRDKGGYGQIRINGKTERSNRIAYFLAYGPTALQVCHKPIVCHTPACCNPNHLYAGDDENQERDRVLDGTSLSRQVICSDGMIYPSLHEAARQTGIPTSNIHRVCKGYKKSAGGYGWAYLDESDGKPWSPNLSGPRPVIRSDGRIYSSIAEAARQNGVCKQVICNVCRGRRKSAGGYGWSYYAG